MTRFFSRCKPARKVGWTLLGIGLLLALPQAQTRARDTGQRIDYREMSRILSSFDPGIDHMHLHFQHMQSYPFQPMRNRYRYSYGSVHTQKSMIEDAGSSLSGVLVLANAQLYDDDQAKPRIDRYVQDIHVGHECPVALETIEGGSPESLKALIREYYAAGLSGVVLIGRLPAAWFEVPNDHYWWEGGYGYANWTCDLFFMDLDGQWEDRDGNGIYDFHTQGLGDRGPEIFIGRIDASTMGSYGTEVELLARYLDKDHTYWAGDLEFQNYGLVYTDHDWANTSTYYFRNLYGLGHYDALKWQDSLDNRVYKQDYLDLRLPDTFYGFTQIWTHAAYTHHSFHMGGDCYESEVNSRNPRSLGYNINGCHACDWAAGLGNYFLGGGYIFNHSPSSLAVVGTTKVGGMLGFESFYQSLGENHCLGTAFLDWFADRLHSSEEYGFILGWHYGMVLIGDPLIAFRRVPGVSTQETMEAMPSNFSCRREENRSLFTREYLNILSWDSPPSAVVSPVSHYCLYEFVSNALVHIADIPAGTNRYLQRNAEDRLYRYGITAVNTSGHESSCVWAVYEND